MLRVMWIYRRCCIALWPCLRIKTKCNLKVTMISVVGLLYILVLSLTSGVNHAKEDPRSTYVCQRGRCLSKASLDGNLENVTTFTSLENCRLLCGKYGNLWPIPTLAANLGKELLEISPSNIQLTVNCCGEPVKNFLDQVFALFLKNMVTECGSLPIHDSSSQVQIKIHVDDENLDLKMATSEEYKLQISSIGDEKLEVVINATTVFGARHALETLSQLTGRRQEEGQCSIFMMTTAYIRDKPVFSHRGLLIDTARNFIPLVDLERTIDAMSANKLNVFHWHATDSHSFPLHIDRVPELANLGAYSAKEIYTEDDIKNLVEFAKLRGVRILMEIDAPAHAGNGWQFGERNGLGKLVVCRNAQPWKHYCVQPPCGQLNPVNPNLYAVLGELYKGIQDLIPSDEMFHMGGDEVYIPCWNLTKEITDFMDLHHYPRSDEGFMRLWTDFQKKALDTWDERMGHNNTKIVMWTSDLTKSATITQSLDPKRYIIETWTDQFDKLPAELLQLGYGVIFATTDVWYLDHGFWGRTTYHTWKHVYDYKIPEKINVLGGEAALWSEYVDSNSLDNRLWPRGSALAERLWSSPQFSAEDAEYRLLEMRARQIRRGVRVDQTTPQWCYINQGMCAPA